MTLPYDIINKYQPKNEQETKDKQLMLDFIERNPDYLLRSNLAAHLTSSAFVVNESMTKVVFAYHHIYQSWAWVGGHNDGNPNSLEVAVKEAKEETGLKSIRPYTDDLFTIDVIYVPNHIKKGIYVSDHLHLNMTYLLIADEDEIPNHNPEEHAGVKWFSIDEVFDYVFEDRMKSVYQKAFYEMRRRRY